MDVAEIEENLFVTGEPKLHSGMCKALSAIYSKALRIFPDVEAARPRSTSGIQALCALHIALEKNKNILQHCCDCSILYLAITGDSIVSKFNKAKGVLTDGLRRAADIVPQATGYQISELLQELEAIQFAVEPLEKQLGDEIIALLQHGRKFDTNSNDNDRSDFELFYQAASRLGITSSRSAIQERRALKKIIERARSEEDKRKEAIAAYLLHLMKKYSKLIRNEVSDDNDSRGSTPCSPTVLGSCEDSNGFENNIHAFGPKFSKLGSFNFKPIFGRSGQLAVPPEELRCPISLQLMYDPVIIASGQTYERVCIEKWFNDGHNTCPKTQQQLPHLSLTPNYCVKGLVVSWCDQNEVPVPDGPPDSLDLNYWRLGLCENESLNLKTENIIESFEHKEAKVHPLNEAGILEVAKGTEVEDTSELEHGVNTFERYEDFLCVLQNEESLTKKCSAVEQIRHLLRDDEEARTYMGANGFVEVLLQFLEFAVRERDGIAQEAGAMALFNLAVNNNRNKEMMLAAGILPILKEMITDTDSLESASALYLNISCLDKAKVIIGSSEAVPFLIQILQSETNSQCKMDALHTLYNLSTQLTNIPYLLSANIIDALQALIFGSGDRRWTEKCMAVLTNIASSKSARDEMISSPDLISSLTNILDVGEPAEQEQATACLLILCIGNEKFCQMVLQEGVIPSLVSLSVNGTTRGKQKAQKLLMLFREQRQQEKSVVNIQLKPEFGYNATPMDEPRHHLSKSTSGRKIGKSWSLWWKNKSYSVHKF